MNIDIEAFGVDAVVLELEGLIARASDAAPAFELLSREFETAERSWFDSHGGGSWPPLAAGTSSRKRRSHRPTSALLVDRGRLRGSLVGHTDESIRYIGAQSLAFGTRVPYARFHQYGTAKMPARPPLVESLKVEPAALKTLATWIVGRFGVVQ